MLAKITTGNVEEDYYIGNTHIFICNDAYMNRTQEDRNAVLCRTGQIATAIQLHEKAGSKKNDP